jgi:hypothetical protein
VGAHDGRGAVVSDISGVLASLPIQGETFFRTSYSQGGCPGLYYSNSFGVGDKCLMVEKLVALGLDTYAAVEHAFAQR